MLTLSSLMNYIDTERLIHAAKTALACLIGFVVARLLHFPIDQWLIITILVVMCAQVSVGSMIQKSNSRFLGTVIGTIVATLTLLIFPQNYLANTLVIALCGAFFSYIATSETPYSDAGTLGAVTITTILISQNPGLITAGERFIEISVGILIASLVSQLVLPIQAKSHLRHEEARTILQLKKYYLIAIISEQTKENIAYYRYLDEEIAKSFSTQRNLAKYSKQERFGGSFSQDQFTCLIICEKEIFRSMTCMRNALDMLSAGRKLLTSLPEVQDFNKSIEHTLEQLAPCFTRQIISNEITLPSLFSLKQAIATLQQQSSEESSVYIDGYLFGAELLVKKLQELISHIKPTN